MSEVAFIVLARAIHVMSGVTWAGASFLVATVITPALAPGGAHNSGPWVGTVARRAGALTGISAMLTVLSGVFLFAVLHPHDSSAGGLVLKSGAMAALLSLAVGLRTRTVLSARVSAALLAVAVLAMAVFRYAAAVG
jgi:uncharacterized membrane protein